MLRAAQLRLQPSLNRGISAVAIRPQLPTRLFSTNHMGGGANTPPPPKSPLTWLADKMKVRSPQQIVADPEKFNRWMIVPAAVGTHISLGSVFAFSILTQPMMQMEGVVAAAASDWSLGQVMPIFSTLMATFGLSSFLLGRFGMNERFGPR